jgi:hypothetical protein
MIRHLRERLREEQKFNKELVKFASEQCDKKRRCVKALKTLLVPAPNPDGWAEARSITSDPDF